ncbi:MAG: hypothetical protein WBG73_15375 [Coleofasciculaceae cyanobacterium]
MKNSLPKNRFNSSVEHSTTAFDRKKLYILLLVFAGGIAMDSWFNHHPQPFMHSLIEPSAHSTSGSLL